LEMCVQKALKIYGMNAAIVYLYGKNNGMMEAIYHSDVSDETVKLISGQKTISYLSNIIKSGNPFYINLEKNSGFPPDINNIITKEKWRAVSVLPLQHRESIIGCLLVASHSIDEIYSFLKNALEMVTAQMGNVIGRLQAEEELRESEEKFRAVFEGSSDGYLASSSEFENFVFSNPKMSEITGYTHEELLKLNISGIHPAEDLLYIIDCFNKIKEGKISIVENVPVLRKDKKIIYCDITGKNIKIGDKEYTFEIFRDITARKKAEEELRLKDFAISSSINGFIIADMEGKITYANDSLLTIWGNSLEESLGRHVTEFFESPDTAIDAMKALLENGKWTGELKGKKRDGSVFYILLSANLVKNNHGDPLYMMGSVLDITERKLSEKALKESEEKYREIFNNVQVGLTRTRISDGKILDCNELFAKLTGFKNREECIASGVTSLHYKDPALRNRVVKELYEKGKVDMVETEATKADGTPFWVSYSARLIPGENCIEGAIIDITRRKEAEDALRISEERFRRLSEAAEEGIAIHDQGLIIEANEALARMFGYDLPELIGLHAEKLATPETWKVILGHLSTNNDGPYEGTGVKKNGTEFWCRLSGKPYQYKGRTLRVATFIDIGERKSAEDLIRIQRDIMVTLGSTTDLSKAFDQILQILLQRDEIDCGALYLVDARSEAYLISHANFSPEFLKKISHYSPDTPQAQLIKEGKAFYQPYSELTFSHDKVREKEGLRAMAIIPIRHEGKPVACINLSSHIHNEIPMNFRTMLESLAAQLGEIIIRIETRKALENSEYKFATAFKSSASMMAISTLEEGCFIEVNDEFLNKLGYQRDEIIGNTSGKLRVFRDIRQWETIKQIALRENFARNLEVTLRTKNGVLLDCLFSAHVIMLDGVTCWLTVAHDITERIRMETFLHIQHDLSIALSGVTEIKEALNLVLEAGTSYEDINAGGIYLVNAEMGGLDLISYKNLSADFVKQNSRYGPEEEKVKIIKIGRPAYASTHDNIDKATLEAEGLKSLAVMPILHQGRVVACMNIASRIYEEIPEAARNFLESIASQVGGAISRLRFEKELKDSEEKFRAITENSSDMIVIISIDGKYTYISPALVKLLGYSSGELIGKTPSLYIYPDDLSLLEDAAARSLENPGTPISLRDFRAYKRNRDALILSGTIINMLDIKGVEGIVGVFHDVTERKRMEEQIQNHNRLLQEAIRKTEWEMEELMEKHLRIEKLAAIGQVYGNIAHDI
ncbi:MAG: PAS domain S-box protein, partial [Spirochaetes bacterium]|nr:PAS domain S-box protein [Spirochaetota bacterium]